MPRGMRFGNSTLVSLGAAREGRPQLVKLLVLAQTPPPLHGQSVMVQAMLQGLARQPDFTVHHVNFRLSLDNADIGRWRLAKVLGTFALVVRAIGCRLQHGCDTLYYVPAPPGKRGALYRDWLVMALCRPFFRKLVLHWHAAGLAAWLKSDAHRIERGVTRAVLSGADLSIVLSHSLRADAEYFHARVIAVVPNGVPDPGRIPRPTARYTPFQVLFLGLCSEEKGVFAAIDAVIAANLRAAAAADHPHFTFIAAGPFPDDGAAARFRRLADSHPSIIRHAGFANDVEKKILFAESGCLLFPTHYAAEGLPLVVLEAFAHGVPVIATRWRALADVVSRDCGMLVEPHDPAALVDALVSLQQSPLPMEKCRERFLRDFELSIHLARLTAALRQIEAPASDRRT